MMNQLKELIKEMVENSDKTPKVAVNFATPGERRLQAIEDLAKQVVSRLHLDSRVKFVNKSSRSTGAIAFSVFDNNLKEIILKIQPIDEIGPYKKSMQAVKKMPKNIAVHFPQIYKVGSLSDLKIENPVIINATWENLGFILMEKLDELPGNMFDIIKGQKDDQKLKSLISDRNSFTEFIEDILDGNEKSIARIISTSSGKESPEIKMKMLKNYMILAMYDKNLRSALETNGFVTENEIYAAVVAQAAKWVERIEAENPKRALSSISSMIKMMISFVNKRPIPKEVGDSSGPTRKLKGIDRVNDALDNLSKYGIIPSDLHANNIMIRPETGEIVFSDIGHFHFK